MAAKIVEEFRKTQQVGQSCRLLNRNVKTSFNMSCGKYKISSKETKAPLEEEVGNEVLICIEAC